MYVRSILILGILGLSVGCATTRNQPAGPPPGYPPPGYAPPMGYGAPAPAPSGCSSCGGSTPVVVAPRYTPPITASPAIPQTAPAVPAIALGSPVNPSPVMGPLQVAFKPGVAPLETAKLGHLETEPSTIPIPPME